MSVPPQNITSAHPVKGKITAITRGEIQRVFSQPGFFWAGDLGEVRFLKRLYDLDAMPSDDPRHRTAEQDIVRHRIANDDWPDDYVFHDGRFLGFAGDEELLEFLCLSLHPEVRASPIQARKLCRVLNRHLRVDGVELYEDSAISGRPVFAVRSTLPRTRDLISKKALRAFREHFSSHYVLRTIAAAFEDAGIEEDSDFETAETGDRRRLVERYYHSLDLRDETEVAKLVCVFEDVLRTLADSTQPEDARHLSHLVAVLQGDGYLFENGRLTRNAPHPGLPHVGRVAIEMDAIWMSRQLATIQSHEDSNPALAIGTAKELVETVCKTILFERGEDVGRALDLPQLMRATTRALQLAPEDVPESAKAADIIRRLLQNFATVGQNLAELRQLYGTGHGPEGRTKGLQPRHARLAAGSAATIATFLLETHKVRGGSVNPDGGGEPPPRRPDRSI